MRKTFLILLLVWHCQWVNAEPVSFALISDVPYNRIELQQLPLLIAEINAQPLAFVVHGGDIKSGASICSDEAFQVILANFQLSQHPLVFVPGDNEWTDCHHRHNAGFDPVERLNRLRALFWFDDHSLGLRRMKLERQSSDPAFAAYRENVRWETAGVMFVGLNLPGSENNYYGTTIGSSGRAGPSPEFIERGIANRAWLKAAFDAARERKMPGLVILAHANPGFEAWNAGKPAIGYEAFLTQLREETLAFDGQVVLVHGDSHNQHQDQPMIDAKTGAVIANFTRLETFGSPTMGWVQGSIDVADPKLFSFVPHAWPSRGDSAGVGK